MVFRELLLKCLLRGVTYCVNELSWSTFEHRAGATVYPTWFSGDQFPILIVDLVKFPLSRLANILQEFIINLKEQSFPMPQSICLPFCLRH
jgi:hypothetical protein